jgi:putative nucleotidyltransferase with HDIG domain
VSTPHPNAPLARVLKVTPAATGEGGPVASWRRLRSRKRDKIGAYAALALVYIALVVSVSPNLFSRAAHVRAGTVWEHPDIVTPYALQVADPAGAMAQRQNIESRHTKVFLYDSGREMRARDIAAQLTELIARARHESGVNSVARLQGAISTQLGLSLQPETVRQLLTAGSEERVRTDLETIMHHMYSARGLSADKTLLETSARSGRLMVVRGGNANSATMDTTPSLESVLSYPGEAMAYLEGRYLPTFGIPQEQQQAYSDIVRQLMQPNIVLDRNLTSAKLQQALASLQPSRTVQAGERLVARGQIVTPFQAEALAALAMQVRHYKWLRALGAALLVGLAIAFVFLYAHHFNPALGFTARTSLLIAMPVLISISLGRFALNVGGAPVLGTFAFPAGMVGMLCVTLFDARLALVLVTLASMLFGLALGSSYPYVLVSLIGGYTGVASLYKIKERHEVLMAGLNISLVNCLTALGVGLVISPNEFEFSSMLGAVGNGLICYSLAVALLPFFEAMFRVTTDVRLMELTSMHHPLLQELESKAPGSYQHSLNVAKLAESAADAVGARYLLVRAGAFFHDIGKSVKPKYYVENQVTPEERRIHSKLSPYMSNLIIKNHVRDGIELARRYHLPERVIDFVPQHHGTSLIKFFYVQALKKADSEDMVHEEEFRYPGPKPQTIEAAIVMLADTVDATATAKFSNATLDEDDLRKMVRDSILDKFNDGQFDECHMTFRDLHRISEAFVRSLLSRFHHRIEYPDMPKRETRELPGSHSPHTLPDRAPAAIAHSAT